MTKVKPLPPLEKISKFLQYEPGTGFFYWRAPRKGVRVGSRAGKIFQPNKNRTYWVICFSNNTYYAHRLAYYFCTGIDPGQNHIDHADGDGLNNRFANLRLALPSQNNFNQRKRADNTSGYKGVSKHRNKWRAEINAYGTYRHLGTFDTPELAHMAYCKAAAELHGEFARGQ